MRRSLNWILSVLAIAGLTGATAAKAQATHQDSSGKTLKMNTRLMQGGPKTDGGGYP